MPSASRIADFINTVLTRSKSESAQTSRRFSQEAKDGINDIFGTTGERHRLRSHVPSQSLSSSSNMEVVDHDDSQ
jgi:hypothetical protein